MRPERTVATRTSEVEGRIVFGISRNGDWSTDRLFVGRVVGVAWTTAWLNLSVVDGYLGRVVGPYLSSSGGSIN